MWVQDRQDRSMHSKPGCILVGYLLQHFFLGYFTTIEYYPLSLKFLTYLAWSIIVDHPHIKNWFLKCIVPSSGSMPWVSTSGGCSTLEAQGSHSGRIWRSSCSTLCTLKEFPFWSTSSLQSSTPRETRSPPTTQTWGSIDASLARTRWPTQITSDHQSSSTTTSSWSWFNSSTASSWSPSEKCSDVAGRIKQRGWNWWGLEIMGNLNFLNPQGRTDRLSRKVLQHCKERNTCPQNFCHPW